MTVYFAGHRVHEIPQQRIYGENRGIAAAYPMIDGAQTVGFCSANSLNSQNPNELAFQPEMLAGRAADGGFRVEGDRILFETSEHSPPVELFVRAPDGSCSRRNRTGQEQLGRGRHVFVLTSGPQAGNHMSTVRVGNAILEVTDPETGMDLDHPYAGRAIAHRLVRRLQPDADLSVLVAIVDINPDQTPRGRLLRHFKRLSVLLGSTAAAATFFTILGLHVSDNEPAVARVSDAAPAYSISEQPKNTPNHRQESPNYLLPVVAAIAIAGVVAAQIRVLRAARAGWPTPANPPRPPVAASTPPAVVAPRQEMRSFPNPGSFRTLPRQPNVRSALFLHPPRED